MPDRREFLQSAFPGALAGAAGTAGAQTSAPNVLLIMADQLRADALGAYGNPVIRTPHIDGLARGGTVFTRHFTPHPVCMPSRASIFTGRYPGAHGVRTNGVRLSEKEVTMAEVFRRSGYRTGGAGKFHFIPHILNVFPSMEKNSGPYYGFEDYHIGEDAHRGEIEHWLNRKGPGFFKTPDHLLPLELHPSTWVAGHTTRFIRECAGQGKPFFAFASFVDPHQGYDPPPPYRDMYRESDMPQPVFRAGEHDLRPPFYNTILGRFDRLNQRPLYNRAQYYGEVSLIDDCVGRILATLDELKIRDNTLIVFTSDHGDLLGDHRYWFKGFYHFHQCTRTPLIFHWAGRVKAGKKVEGMAQAIDIFPTVTELAGLKNPPGVQGRSQAKVAAGGETGTGWSSALIEFLFRGVEAPGAQDDWQTHELCTLVTPEWRMSHYPGMAFGELYDLTADPNELSNVWGQPKYEAVRRRLRDELLDRVMQAHDPLPVRETMY